MQPANGYIVIFGIAVGEVNEYVEPQGRSDYDRAMRCLVTAGNTREKIARVRDWGNIFTGRTGLARRRAVSRIGAGALFTCNRKRLGELARGRGTTVTHGVWGDGRLWGGQWRAV